MFNLKENVSIQCEKQVLEQIIWNNENIRVENKSFLMYFKKFIEVGWVIYLIKMGK